jgi:tRNA(Ile)-lysidine synthase
MTLLDQVRATIAQHKLVEPGDTVVVGVSGGPDSLALLHALRALRAELGIALHVAHLNHRLRGDESDADAQFVAQLAREWQLPATIEARDVAALARERKLSVEEAARHARYAFLAQVAQRVGARVIAVAHNADDQVETVLMHLMRGAGLAGLRGMQYKSQIPNSQFHLVRPLLDVQRVEIESYCKQHYLKPRFDRSNLDTTFFRNRLRHEVLPFLEKLNPNLRRVLLRAARAIADDYDFLHAQARDAFARVAREEGGAIVFDRAAWRALHPALQRGTLRAAVQRLRGDLRNIDWTHVEDARRVALEKPTGAQATLPDGLMLTVGYDDFIVADAARAAHFPDLPLLRVERLPLPAQGVAALPDSDWVVETRVLDRRVETSDRWSALLDFEKCRGEIFLRRRCAGDRFQPAGMDRHTKLLSEFMIDAKIPRDARDALPLLVVGDQIAWVCGWRVDARAHTTAATRQFLQITFRKREQH